MRCVYTVIVFFNDTSTTENYTLSPTRRSSDLKEREREREREKERKREREKERKRERERERERKRGSEEHTSELQSRGRISYAVFCLKKKKKREKKKKKKRKKKRGGSEAQDSDAPE